MWKSAQTVAPRSAEVWFFKLILRAFCRSLQESGARREKG